MDLDVRLRHQIYNVATRRGKPPTIAELSDAAGEPIDRIPDALSRLAAGRIVVLQPESGEILMAPPFSAVPTPFVVQTARHSSYANCAWDALGVPIMLGEPAHLVSSCGCCGTAFALDVTVDRPPSAADVIHFGVPAARWWQDLVYT